jgi:hypothetical protein
VAHNGDEDVQGVAAKARGEAVQEDRQGNNEGEWLGDREIGNER